MDDLYFLGYAMTKSGDDHGCKSLSEIVGVVK